MFDYNKTIQKHLDLLLMYEDPHALEEHMKRLYTQYKTFLASTVLWLLCALAWWDDFYAVISTISSAMCFSFAVKTWIDLKDLVMYKFLREKCAATQHTTHSTDD